MKLRKHKSISLLISLSSCALLSACGGETAVVGAPTTSGAQAPERVSTTSEKPILEKTTLTQLADGAEFIVGEITVAPGFSISRFHEGVGRGVRHIVVRENGDVLVARRDGTLIGLRDTDQDGIADEIAQRKAPITTGIDMRDGYLYVSDLVSLSRVRLDEALVPGGDFETIISGFPEEQQHADKTFTFDDAGNIYVNSGAPSNACQEEARSLESPGLSPCPQLENYAGIWKFNGTVSGQTPEDGTRFATGVRNAVALDWNSNLNGLFIAMHGRDQLSALWPDYFDDDQSATLPAEELHLVKQGANLGWPYTYYDPSGHTRYLAPEYGGDGKKTPDTEYQEPLYGFPAHWAPNDILSVKKTSFPAPFNEGALIAFHGSWNRAPLPQAGYRVSFIPMTEGEISGLPIDFAVGFPLKENIASSRDAEHRPMGLAMGPDGALYISDSAKGAIWKITSQAK